MPLLSCSSLYCRRGHTVVLDGVSVSFEPGERVGLVGRNGCGKSTLLSLIEGREQPDRGSVDRGRGTRIGSLAQEHVFEPGMTVRGAAAAAFEQLESLRTELEATYEAMAVAEGDGLEKLMRQQVDIEARLEAAGGWVVDHRIEATLHGLGFTDEQFEQPASTLSGGEQARLALARLLLEEPDLLLLDEPTNHLDIDGRRWLEGVLTNAFRGAIILVSHDRWLLERACSRTIELANTRIRDYTGPYSHYLDQKTQQDLTAQRLHDKNLDRVRREEAFIRKYKAGQRAKQARGRAARLDRFKEEHIEEPDRNEGLMNLQLPETQRSGDQVLQVEGISMAWDGESLFKGLDLAIQRGERIGIVGPNGSGKTTLVRCLLGEIDSDEGDVRIGSRLNIGWYRQTHGHLDPTMEVWQYLQSELTRSHGSPVSEQQARDLAGAFLFSGARQEQALGSLSGGERSRAVLAGIVAGGHNLLVLDEPTNHLDIASAERLEQVLAVDGPFTGTMLLISHDRALLSATCSNLLVLDGRGSAHLVHDVDAWLQGVGEPVEPERTSQPKKKKPAKKTPARDGSMESMSLRDLERRIEAGEQRRAEIDAELVKPEVYSDGTKVKELSDERIAVESDLIPLHAEWERRADEA
ncbi:MAG: ABC-F family ATP-binding cassette domain-containing protein [Phycisphaerales bacterium]|nr:ABC-F family ATP-binding cassette domain-containing protein [Phycisphaerales bacterium]